jgi:hypothetical protein
MCSAHTFRWSYLKTDKLQPLKQNTSRIKPVYQFDLKNNFIKKYNSLTDAFNSTGIQKSSISACATGKNKTSGGYIFKYKNE